MKNYGKLTAGIIAGWFIFALSASALNLFKNASGHVGIAVGLAALIPIAVFSLWFVASNNFRQFALSLNPRILTLAQSWRIIGFVFVLLEARGLLPAGYGDMFIGATATLVAWQVADPGHRKSFILWQVLGIADLITAVCFGTTARLLSPQGASMVALTALPLSLIPTFLVPLFFILHLICIARRRPGKLLRAVPVTPFKHSPWSRTLLVHTTFAHRLRPFHSPSVEVAGQSFTHLVYLLHNQATALCYRWFNDCAPSVIDFA